MEQESLCSPPVFGRCNVPELSSAQIISKNLYINKQYSKSTFYCLNSGRGTHPPHGKPGQNHGSGIGFGLGRSKVKSYEAFWVTLSHLLSLRLTCGFGEDKRKERSLYLDPLEEGVE